MTDSRDTNEIRLWLDVNPGMRGRCMKKAEYHNQKPIPRQQAVENLSVWLRATIRTASLNPNAPGPNPAKVDWEAIAEDLLDEVIRRQRDS